MSFSQDSFAFFSEENPVPAHAPFSCRCILCLQEFSMMSALNSHLAGQHHVITTIIPTDVFIKMSNIPVEIASHESLAGLKGVFSTLSDTIARLQRDETRNNYSHLDYTTQLICKIKNYYTQIENTKKELHKYGSVYTTEFPDDKVSQNTKERVAVVDDKPVTETVKEPPSEPTAGASIQEVKAPLPTPNPLPTPSALPTPIAKPSIQTTITIMNNNGTEQQFITDANKTYYQCVMCCKDLHSVKSCKFHKCGVKLHCEICDTRFRTSKQYEAHKTDIAIVKVPDNILEPIPFICTQTDGVCYSATTMVDCFRNTWQYISRTKENQCFKKNKHGSYLIHKGCNKWETKDQKQLKWHLIYSLSKLLSKHTPGFFGKVIQRIEDTYNNNKDFKDLDKEFSQYSSGWWILPEKKARKKRVVKKAGGGKTAAPKPVTTKPQEASTSTQTETKTKKTRKPREKPPKEEASSSKAETSCQVTYNGRNFYKNKNSYRCLHCGVVLRAGKGCLGHVC